MLFGGNYRLAIVGRRGGEGARRQSSAARQKRTTIEKGLVVIRHGVLRTFRISLTASTAGF